jgi:hypothetical protein
MKAKWLFIAFPLFCLLILAPAPSRAQQYSPGFQALLNLIQEGYLTPKGDDLSSLRDRFPAVVATLIGHALRQQALYIQKDPSLSNPLTSLQNEAAAYVTDVARTTSARFEDGSRFTPEGLWQIVNRAYQGQDDDWVLQIFRVRTGTMPLVLSAQTGTPPPPLGNPPRKKSNEIELLGIRAPSDKEPRPQGQQHPPTPPAPYSLEPDGILGDWASENGKTRLKIWKEGETYLGSMSGEKNWEFSFRNDNEVCLRFRFDAAHPRTTTEHDDYYLLFKGTYNLSLGASNPNFAMRPMAFYYSFWAGKFHFSRLSSACVNMCFVRL